MTNPLTMKSWSPYVVGSGIGVLSWFAFAFADHPLGISTAFEHTAALTEKALVPQVQQTNEYFAKKAEAGKSPKIGLGWKNVTNILKEVKGAEIEVVCHGGGIGLLVKDKTYYADDVARLIKEGVRFAACENTLRDKSIPKEYLLPDVTTVQSGAVELIRKQQEGFGYFKP